MLTIVTGASQNHYKTLVQFINSFLYFYKDDTDTRLVVYNLGLDNVNGIPTNFNIKVELFDFTKYPLYFNIKINAGEYAWKPVILFDTCEKYNSNVVWMDAGNIILSKLDDLVLSLEQDGIHTGVTSGKIIDWTFPKTLEIMKCDNKFFDYENRNGACVGVNYDLNWVKRFVVDWKDCALNKDCIAPEGSSRLNHRQDQAILSVLYYQYQNIYKFKGFNNQHWKFFLGYSIHNDCD